MQEFKIIDEKRYPLHVDDTTNTNDLLSYWRWEHRATISYRGRRFMVFVDNGIQYNNQYIVAPKAYIEELTTSGLEKIEDDSLLDALSNFAQKEENNFCDIMQPMIKVAL